MTTELQGLSNALAFVPTSAQDVWASLAQLDKEQEESRITFAIAGALFLAGLKAGFYPGRAGIDRYVLFFKFVESIDPKQRFEKTFLNLCGRFVNYCGGKLVQQDGFNPNASAHEAIRAIMDGLGAVATAPAEQQARVMRALLRVRDASHLFVAFSYDWSQRFSDFDRILEAKFGCRPDNPVIQPPESRRAQEENPNDGGAP
ncbi:hypothetical protein [Candidatus Nitrospira bockiana]